MRIAYRQATLLITAGLVLAANLATAQETPKGAEVGTMAAQTKPVSVFRLDFVVRELEDGKRLNSRIYSLSGKGGDWASFRVGSMVPTYTLESQGTKGIQYQDVGINIDCRPDERDNQVLLETRFESSSVVTPEKPTEERGYPYLGPVIRRVRLSCHALVTPGKPTVIGTLDDVATNRRYEIEVTVTKVK